PRPRGARRPQTAHHPQQRCAPVSALQGPVLRPRGSARRGNPNLPRFPSRLDILYNWRMSAPRIFDRVLLRQRRRRALALGPAPSLIDRVADALADRLAAVLRRFTLAADLGSPTGAVRRALAAYAETVIAVDAIAQTLTDYAGPKVVADEEALPFAD